MEYKENMTQEEFDKAIQSAEDRIRTEYSKKVKDIEAELEVSKTELEQTKVENESLKVEGEKLQLSNKLVEKGLSPDLVEMINFDGDLDAKIEKLQQMIGTSKQENFVPTKHKTGEQTITKEQFKTMGYMKQAELATANPELYQQLSK